MKLKLKIIIITIISFYSKALFSQCINTFPNTQNFETAPTWTAGGTNSDWAWGNPSKPVISGAGSGSKCWIIGGLTTSNYNGLQQSYIQSPCYDFSLLTYPTVSFKVFWEMEYRYDGASLQYSTNNGLNWTTIGSSIDPINCNTDNWYNYATINYLNWVNTKNGWSGNSKPTNGGCQGGSGSLGWVTAKHCINNLAGLSNVQFRFVFGSGQTCNGFDGFAIDDFTIENAITTPVTFTNTCTNFTSINSICQSSLNYNWNFGDASASLANNTSTLSNPTHVYSGAGVYTVSLSTTNGPCGSVTSFTKTVSVLGSAITAQTNVTCKGGNNGSATVIPLTGNTNYTYSWTPEGGMAPTASNLTAGNYSVTISDANGCTSTSSVTITEPNITTGVASQTVTSCLGNTSLLQVITSGITDPITYLWTPGGYTTNSITITPSVTTVFTVNVTVTGACPKTEQKIITNQVVPKPIISFTNSATNGCAPLCVNLIDNSSTPAGSIIANNWSFSNGNSLNTANATICFNNAGTYKANYGVTNSFGCTNYKDSVLTIIVYPTPVAAFVEDKNNFTDLEETLVTFVDQSTGSPNEWEWNFAGLEKAKTKNTNFSFLTSGTYPVILAVSNQFGCSNTVTHTISVLPEFTCYIPNTFSPNDDGLNDVFIPKGRGWNTATYKLAIFNRWGLQLFYTQDVQQGWNGKTHGSSNFVEDGIYTYKIEVGDNSSKLHSYIGNVTIIK